MAGKAIKHVGFKGAVAKVVAQGKSPKAAAKIIGAGKANASPAAKKANPALKKVAAKVKMPKAKMPKGGAY